MTKKSLYDPQVYQDCITRLQQLTADTPAHWGRMDAAQMLAHCSEIMEVANGKELKNTPLLAKLFKGYIRKMVVGDKPYAKGTQTHPQYRQHSPRNFEEEKSRLQAAMEQFFHMDKEAAANLKHGLFGNMTLEERGWSSFKHLDHHLRQFGI